jgi:hypothetical protein
MKSQISASGIAFRLIAVDRPDWLDPWSVSTTVTAAAILKEAIAEVIGDLRPIESAKLSTGILF